MSFDLLALLGAVLLVDVPALNHAVSDLDLYGAVSRFLHHAEHAAEDVSEIGVGLQCCCDLLLHP